jgi:exopolysaccharide biosynthesis operon protein EpsL
MATQSRKLGAGLAALLGFATTMQAAHAGPEDAFNLEADMAVNYDSNLFRLNDSRPLPAGVTGSRSDVIYRGSAGLHFDRTYSLQRFTVDATATRSVFQEHSFLDFTALEYSAAWLWSVTPRLTGTLSADRTEALTSYADLSASGNRNVQRRESQRFLADWQMTGSWHLVGGLIRATISNTSAFNAVGSYTQDTAEGGVRYVPSVENAYALILRDSRGDYQSRSGFMLPLHFDQKEAELQARWQITGHSSIDGRVGYLDRTHETYSQRDFSGAVGAVNYRWLATGKLQFNLTAGRDMYSYQQDESSYFVGDYVMLTPLWAITEKTQARLRIGVTQRDYRGAVVGSTNREDIIRSAQVGVLWKPTRSLDIDAQVTAEQRSSNADGLGYHATMAGITAILKF